MSTTLLGAPEQFDAKQSNTTFKCYNVQCNVSVDTLHASFG